MIIDTSNALAAPGSSRGYACLSVACRSIVRLPFPGARGAAGGGRRVPRHARGKGGRWGPLSPKVQTRWFERGAREGRRKAASGGGRRNDLAEGVPSPNPVPFPFLPRRPGGARPYPWGPRALYGAVVGWALPRRRGGPSPFPWAWPERQSGPGPTAVACGRWTRRFRWMWGSGGTPRPFPLSRAAGRSAAGTFVPAAEDFVGGRASASASSPGWLAGWLAGLACFEMRPQIRRGDPLNLSILVSGGKETNQDSLSNGE